MLAEHGDQSAIAILREALADVADLPPSAEITHAQAELARALMVQGSPEALVWCERVLENPQLTSQSVLVHTLITKGSALVISTGRTAEAEAVLRGAIVLADRLGEPHAMLRARNNLTGIVDPQSTQGSIDLARELFEIGQRYGERTWVQQAIGGCPDRKFRSRALGCLAGRGPRRGSRRGRVLSGLVRSRRGAAGWPSADERTRPTGFSPRSGPSRP